MNTLPAALTTCYALTIESHPRTELSYTDIHAIYHTLENAQTALQERFNEQNRMHAVQEGEWTIEFTYNSANELRGYEHRDPEGVSKEVGRIVNARFGDRYELRMIEWSRG
jgi:hypothetical protein